MLDAEFPGATQKRLEVSISDYACKDVQPAYGSTQQLVLQSVKASKKQGVRLRNSSWIE